MSVRRPWRLAGRLQCMGEADDLTELLDEVARTFNPLVVAVRQDGDTFVAELAREDGTIFWPNYAHGPSEVLAVLAAEQRFLVEDQGSGAVSGATYVDKARERLCRWQAAR
jgi:hypothetical protein